MPIHAGDHLQVFRHLSHNLTNSLICLLNLPIPSQPFATPYTLPERHCVPHISSIHGHTTPSNTYSPYQCTKLPYSSSCAWMYPTSDARDLPSDATCITLHHPCHSCDQSYDTMSLTPRLTTIDQPCMMSQTTSRPVSSTILLPYL